MPQIYVDADACPVKAEVLKVAERHQMRVSMVANTGLRPSRDPLVRMVTVPKDPDAADDWIAEEIAASDIVVTADIPLADRALKKDAYAIGPTGRIFDTSSIGMALAMRNLNQHLRETGESRGLNASFTPRDRSNFLQAFDTLCIKAKRTAPGGAAQ
ncbi:YaiI/YqxD family protein [Pelagibacterium montanilacus]|uniref:YaiI/YqxD family protein n=1 Tax=Pelagibacterium montanilacus TaxID=2185280 RepID=UPI000F8D9721|nr:YaiI/YqxD family protein [Pelagibacterium montanilacus]